MHVFNIHLQANHLRDSFRNNMLYNQIRQDQLREVRQFIISKCHHDGNPWLIGGDFNIDAISGSITDSIGITEPKESLEGETNEYKIMVNLIDPSGKSIDLLKVRFFILSPTSNNK